MNWGGARPGSGRKNLTMTQKQVQTMLKAAKTFKARANGVSIDDILLQVIYAKQLHGEQIKVSERLHAIKIFKEFTMVKVSEQTQNINLNQSPQIYLPKQEGWRGEEKELGQEGQGRQEGETSGKVLRH